MLQKRNSGNSLQQQLQAVLDQFRKEEIKKVKARVEAEEHIRLDRAQQEQHLREVHAWEGSQVYLKGPATDGAEKKVFCCRVGRTFLTVRENGGEPVRVERSGLGIRTPEERLLAILDEKIEGVRKHETRRLEAARARLDKLCETYNKEMRNLSAFRSRVYAALVRRGLIIPKRTE